MVTPSVRYRPVTTRSDRLEVRRRTRRRSRDVFVGREGLRLNRETLERRRTWDTSVMNTIRFWDPCKHVEFPHLVTDWNGRKKNRLIILRKTPWTLSSTTLWVQLLFLTHGSDPPEGDPPSLIDITQRSRT